MFLNMFKKYFLITFILCSCSFVWFAKEAVAWTDQQTKKKICERIFPDRHGQSVDIAVLRPDARNKFLIPPQPVVTRLNFRVAKHPGSEKVFMSMKYGSPASKSSRDPEDITHPNPSSSDFEFLTDLRADTLVRFDATGSRTSTPFTFDADNALREAGEYFYVYLYGGRNRVGLISLNISVNVSEALKWCGEGTKPVTPVAEPAPRSQAFTERQSISVSSAHAEKIYYLITKSDDPEKNPDRITDEPSADNYDQVINRGTGQISLTADTDSNYRKYNLRLTGCNQHGCSRPTEVLSYTIDKRPLQPSPVVVKADSGGVIFPDDDPYITESTDIKLYVSSNHATHLYYTYQVSVDGNDPDLPEDPSVAASKNRIYLEGSSYIGHLFRLDEDELSEDELIEDLLTTDPEVEKKAWLRFAGYNERMEAGKRFGDSSEVYQIILRGSARTPGSVTAIPGDGTVFRERGTITVECPDATDIHYQVTNTGAEPKDPKDEVLFGHKINSDRGPIVLSGRDGVHNTVKVRLRGYNSQSKTWGPDSTFTYTVDLRGTSPGPEYRNLEDCLNRHHDHNYCYAQFPGEVSSIQVNLGPDSAAAAGARWKVKDHNSGWTAGGQTIQRILQGQYTILFKPDVEGWFPPLPQNISLRSGEDYRETFNYRHIQPGFYLTQPEAKAYPGIDLSAALQGSVLDASRKIFSDGNNSYSIKDLLQSHLDILEGSWRGGKVNHQSSQNDLLFEFPGQNRSFPLRLSAVKTTGNHNNIDYDNQGRWVFDSWGLNIALEPVCLDWVQDLLSSEAEWHALPFGGLKVPSGEEDKYLVMRCGDARSGLTSEDSNLCLDSGSPDRLNQTLVPYLLDTDIFAESLEQYGLDYEIDPDNGEWMFWDRNACFQGFPLMEYNTRKISNSPMFELIEREQGVFEFFITTPNGTQALELTLCQ